MTRYRSKLQIIAEILEIVSNGARKTHIMYGANLSYKLLCKYLDEIVECGLVKINREDSYIVASKGREFLERFAAYRRLREHVTNEMNSVDEERKLIERVYTNSKGRSVNRNQDLTKKA